MPSLIGTLKATCIRGRGYSYADITIEEAQKILDERFEDRLVKAFFVPDVVPMKSNFVVGTAQ